MSSVKNKTLGKEPLRRVFSFTEGFLCGTRQRASLPSDRKKQLVKYLALDKEPNSDIVTKIKDKKLKHWHISL
jgi:hypothetical protein